MLGYDKIVTICSILRRVVSHGVTPTWAKVTGSVSWRG